MRTWETAVSIVRPLRFSPILVGMALQEITEQIKRILKERSGGIEKPDDEVALRLLLIRRFMLNKYMDEHINGKASDCDLG